MSSSVFVAATTNVVGLIATMLLVAPSSVPAQPQPKPSAPEQRPANQRKPPDQPELRPPAQTQPRPEQPERSTTRVSCEVETLAKCFLTIAQRTAADAKLKLDDTATKHIDLLAKQASSPVKDGRISVTTIQNDFEMVMKDAVARARKDDQPLVTRVHVEAAVEGRCRLWPFCKP